jgi:hypothetical protein
MLCAVLIGAIAAPGQSATAGIVKAKASISGVVLDAGARAPIDADVYASRSTSSNTREMSAQTDSQGRYSFKDLEGGQYRISAQASFEARRGFGPSAVKIVSVAPGQELTTVDIPIRMFGSVSGRVVDENKDPVAGVHVLIIAREYSLGSLRHVLAGMATTDDRGQYTLGRMEAGRGYLLMVRRAPRKLPPIADNPEDPKLRKRVPTPTYYPDSPSLDGAQPIILRAGEKRENVDFQLLRAPSYCVEGVVQAGGPGPLNFTIGQAKVTSGASGNGGFFIVEPGGTAGEDGKLRICELPPGEYSLTVYQSAVGPTGPPFFGVVLITIVDRDVKRLVVSAPAQVPLNCEVSWDGQPPEQPVDAKLFFSLTPLTRAQYQGEQLFERTGVPGEFSFKGLSVDDYSVSVRGVPPDLYVKAITYGNADLMREPLHLGSAIGNQSLRVLIGRDGGKVQATVADKDGNGVADAYVLLLPAAITSEPELAGAMITGQTDQNGLWRSNAIAPGKYLVLATMLPVDKGPESIHKLWNGRTHAAEVEVAANGSAKVTVAPRVLD